MDPVRKICHLLRAPLDAFCYSTFLRSKYHSKKIQWDERIATILECPDMAYFKPVADAGQVCGNVQVMHNGIRVLKGSYYRWRGTAMFERTKGIHEPQEERVFAEVLPWIEPGGVMIELGAYWGFYSIWFASRVKNARCVLVEPRGHNLFLGRSNFQLNGYKGEFIQAGIGARSGERIPSVGKIISVDDLVAQMGVERIDVLHSDVQGYEADMLKGARKTLSAGKVRFIFLSTHSQELHEHCRSTIQEYGFEVIADADLSGTYCFDGVLVGQLKGEKGPGPVPISQRQSRVL